MAPIRLLMRILSLLTMASTVETAQNLIGFLSERHGDLALPLEVQSLRSTETLVFTLAKYACEDSKV